MSDGETMTERAEECAWKTAHDALAAHGRARILGKPETELRDLWDEYCLRLIEATDA